MSDENNITLQPKSIQARLSPYALGVFVRDLDPAINSIDTTERFSAAKLFLLCLAIELSFKSILWANGVTREDTRKCGHDLLMLASEFKKSVDEGLLSEDDLASLERITPYYNKGGGSAKGLVYFEDNMKEQVLSGYDALPGADELIGVKAKLLTLLEGHDYYIKL